MKKKLSVILLLVIAIAFLLIPQAAAAHWPSWLGPGPYGGPSCYCPVTQYAHCGCALFEL